MSLHGIILKASDFKVQGRNVFVNPKKTGGVPGMLLIHANWCHHCKLFASTFNEIADSIGDGFCCASIESEELKGQDSLTAALNFQGFPTICFFAQDGMIMGQYDGARDKSSILDSICHSYHHCIQNHS
jgi:thioredoxin-like negative regulator of GroEL